MLVVKASFKVMQEGFPHLNTGVKWFTSINIPCPLSHPRISLPELLLSSTNKLTKLLARTKNHGAIHPIPWQNHADHSEGNEHDVLSAQESPSISWTWWRFDESAGHESFHHPQKRCFHSRSPSKKTTLELRNEKTQRNKGALSYCPFQAIQF